MPDSVEVNGSRQEVLAAVFDDMSPASKAEAVHSLFARTDITSSRVIGAEVLRAFGLPADKALSVVLDMRPRGETSTLTVDYLVHGDDATRALTSVVKTWRVVPADEGASDRVETLAASLEETSRITRETAGLVPGSPPSELAQIRDCLARIETVLGRLSSGGAAVRVVSA